MECKEHRAKVSKCTLVEPVEAIQVKYGRGPNNEILCPEPLEDAGRILLRKMGKQFRRCRTCFEVFLPCDADRLQCVECVMLAMGEPELYHK